MVLSVDVSPPRRPQRWPYKTEICDIRSPRLVGLVAAFAPQVVVHLAGQVDVADAERAPAADADVNVCGTIAVADAAAAAGNARIVETSIGRLHEIVGAITDRAIPPVLVTEPAGGIERICLRVSRAESTLGWTPKITLSGGIAALVGATAAREPRTSVIAP